VLDVDPFMIAPRRFTDDQIRRAAIRAGGRLIGPETYPIVISKNVTI